MSRDCSACGKAFQPARADAQYCSDTCRQRARRQRAHRVPVTDNLAPVTPASVTDNPDVPVTDNPVRETEPETMQPPPDAFMAALEEHYRGHRTQGV